MDETFDYKLRGRCDVDTHTCTMCPDAIFRLLDMTGQLCAATEFHADLLSIKNILIGISATAYDHSNGVTCILVFSQSLFIGRKLDSLLMSPNQLCENGLVEHTCPRQYNKNTLHSIFVPQENTTIHSQCTVSYHTYFANCQWM